MYWCFLLFLFHFELFFLACRAFRLLDNILQIRKNSSSEKETSKNLFYEKVHVYYNGLCEKVHIHYNGLKKAVSHFIYTYLQIYSKIKRLFNEEEVYTGAD